MKRERERAKFTITDWHAINGNFRSTSTFGTESLLKQSHYYFHNFVVVVFFVVYVVNIFNDPHYKGQAVPKYVAELVN